MKAFLLLHRSINQKQFYRDLEARNIYEYRLIIDDFSKYLIQLHMWELKKIELPYLFQSHNCATLMLHLLSIANEDLVDYANDWLSPLDIIKIADEQNMVDQVSLYPSSDWRIRSIGRELTQVQRKLIFQVLIQHKKINSRKLYPSTDISHVGICVGY